MQALQQEVQDAQEGWQEAEDIMARVDTNRRSQQDECDRMRQSTAQMEDALQAAEQRATAAEQSAAAADQTAAAAQQSAADATAAAQAEVPSSFSCAE